MALRLPGFFHSPTISFLVSRSPFAGQHFHSRSEIQKQQLNTPKILFLHHCTYRNRGLRRMNARCAENVRVSNRGHRPQGSLIYLSVCFPFFKQLVIIISSAPTCLFNKAGERHDNYYSCYPNLVLRKLRCQFLVTIFCDVKRLFRHCLAHHSPLFETSR